MAESGRAKMAGKAAGKAPVVSGAPPVTESVRVLIESLDPVADSPHRRALCEVALNLAGCLDSGAAMASAAISKEVRATLGEIVGEVEQVDDDDFSTWTRQLGVAP